MIKSNKIIQILLIIAIGIFLDILLLKDVFGLIDQGLSGMRAIVIILWNAAIALGVLANLQNDEKEVRD